MPNKTTTTSTPTQLQSIAAVYLREIVHTHLNLPQDIEAANSFASLLLENEKLKQENLRLKYEGNFKDPNTSKVEVVSTWEITCPKPVKELLPIE
ncbi:MAG: hypothetical protein ACRC2R_09245 [Xenococcaceae cyanobacterium]